MVKYKLKAKYQLKKGRVSKTVVDVYKTFEQGIVDGYQNIEGSVVTTYKRIEDKFVEKFLEEIPEQSNNAESEDNTTTDQ